MPTPSPERLPEPLRSAHRALDVRGGLVVSTVEQRTDRGHDDVVGRETVR